MLTENTANSAAVNIPERLEEFFIDFHFLRSGEESEFFIEPEVLLVDDEGVLSKIEIDRIVLFEKIAFRVGVALMGFDEGGLIEINSAFPCLELLFDYTCQSYALFEDEKYFTVTLNFLPALEMLGYAFPIESSLAISVVSQEQVKTFSVPLVVKEFDLAVPLTLDQEPLNTPLVLPECNLSQNEGHHSYALPSLRNIDSLPIKVTLENSAAWLTLIPNSINIKPGQSGHWTAAIDPDKLNEGENISEILCAIESQDGQPQGEYRIMLFQKALYRNPFLTLEQFSYSPEDHVIHGEKVVVTATVKNIGLKPAPITPLRTSSIRPITQLDAGIGPMEKYTLTYEVLTEQLDPGQHAFSIPLHNLNLEVNFNIEDYEITPNDVIHLGDLPPLAETAFTLSVKGREPETLQIRYLEHCETFLAFISSNLEKDGVMNYNIRITIPMTMKSGWFEFPLLRFFKTTGWEKEIRISGNILFPVLDIVKKVDLGEIRGSRVCAYPLQIQNKGKGRLKIQQIVLENAPQWLQMISFEPKPPVVINANGERVINISFIPQNHDEKIGFSIAMGTNDPEHMKVSVLFEAETLECAWRLCPKCNAVVEIEAIFCDQCGTSLKSIPKDYNVLCSRDIKVCPTCRGLFNKNNLYCDQDGTELISYQR